MSEENIEQVSSGPVIDQATMPSGEVETPKAPEAFDPYKIIRELTLEEAMLLGGEPGNERAVMRDLDTYNKYWSGTKYVENIEQAVILPLCEHVSKYKHVTGVSFCVLNPIPEGVRTKRSNLEDHFSENFMKLMQSQPSNPIVRGFITKVLRKEPPAEATTIELLREWVEMNFDKPSRASLKDPVRGQAPQRARRVLELDVRLTETETGKCFYSVCKSSRETVVIDLDWLRDRIDAGDGMGEIVEEIEQMAWNFDDVDWNYNDYEHSNYEVEDITDFRANISNSISQEVETFLSNNDEDLLETLLSRD